VFSPPFLKRNVKNVSINYEKLVVVSRSVSDNFKKSLLRMKIFAQHGHHRCFWGGVGVVLTPQPGRNGRSFV
jgi:hypothetical protein